jgi:hypothetical protein
MAQQGPDGVSIGARLVGDEPEGRPPRGAPFAAEATVPQ